jgi:hypothetical protein
LLIIVLISILQRNLLENMKQFIFFFIIAMGLITCQKNDPATPPILLSEKNISEVIFKSADNPSLSADISGLINSDSIKFQFPAGISLNSLTPTISFSGKSITPSNRTPQNFTAPVSYTITAENGTTRTYIFAIAQQKADTATLISGHWHVFKDSLSDSDNFSGPDGHPTPGVYYGTSLDYYDFGTNGIVSIRENNVTGTSPYQILSNSKLSISVFDVYGYATIETLTANSATVFWSKKVYSASDSAYYFRKLFLSK